MRKIAIILSTLFLFSGMFINVQAQKTKTVDIQTSAQCSMCKEKIQSNIIFEKGIKDVKLDMETKKLSVIYKSKKTDVDAIKNAIASLGYDTVSNKLIIILFPFFSYLIPTNRHVSEPTLQFFLLILITIH